MDKATITRLQLVLALDALCQRSSYGEIAVESICATAGVSRSAFYRLFKTKYSILEWWQSLLIASSIGEIGRSVNWRNGLLMSYDAWALTPYANEAAKLSGVSALPSGPGMAKVKELILETLTEYKRVEVGDSLLFQIDFLVSSCIFSGASNWTQINSGPSSEEMVDLILPCIPRDLFEILDDPVDPRPAEQLTLSRLLMMSPGA